MLSGVETTKEKVLRIILAGQPELNAKLDSPELMQLKQRVRLRFHLTPLSEEDMASYIRHRLDVAGAGGREIFEGETFAELFRYTGGTPRLINTLCDTALLAAFAQDRTTVSLDDLRSAIAELQWVEFAARTHTQVQAQMEDTAPHAQMPVGRLVLSLKGQRISETFLSSGRRVVVGRTPDNDLQVDSKYVSRHHCQVVSTFDYSIVEDLNSTNGVYMQGKRVRRYKLADGDVMKLGMHELAYHKVEATAFEDERTLHTTVLTEDDLAEMAAADADDEPEEEDEES
jgi:pSer/pThr/pTyr-binding forkhead associated (FHA) protein